MDDPMKNVRAPVIEACDTVPAEKKSPAEAFVEHSAGDNKRLRDAVTEVIPDINGIQILRWCWVLQQQRVSKIREFENSLGITIVAHQDIQLLAKLAGAIMGHQAESSETQWKEPHEQTREIERLGPSTQKVSKLNPADQMLMRQAATIVVNTIRENAGWDAAKAAEIEDSDTAPSEKDLAAEAFPEDSVGDKDRLKDVVTEVIPDVSGIQMLKLCCVRQQKRVISLMEIEESAGITVVGRKEIQLLAKIAGALMNHQSKSAKMKWKDDARELTPREIEKLSPLAQRVSKLDPIDRNLLRQAGTMTIDMIQEKFAELKTEQELRENGDNRG